jgi:hypothetical protein
LLRESCLTSRLKGSFIFSLLLLHAKANETKIPSSTLYVPEWKRKIKIKHTQKEEEEFATISSVHGWLGYSPTGNRRKYYLWTFLAGKEARGSEREKRLEKLKQD